MDSLLIGVLIAHYYLNGIINLLFRGKQNYLQIATILVFVLICVMIMKEGWNALGGSVNHTYFAIFYGLFLTVAIVNKNRFEGRLLRLRPLRYLGKISYSVYLYHQLISGLTHKLILNQNPGIKNFMDLSVTMLALTLTILIAILSYKFFEGPLLKYAKKYKYQ